ncbi:hypothetical protein GGH93_002794 [Coemansia aciculifera]|nr:hypothetical protein GGH93_002794 [Coemansia aciculifera]
MELYKQSTAVCDVWDRVDRHMVAKYGVSLLKIVQTNPKKLTVHFGSNVGEELQRNYMSLIRRRSGDKGKVASLFPEITLDSSSYMYRSPTGLLNSTQFTQVALVTFALAAVADMRTNSLVQKGAAFAGHSLGEYAALAALNSVFTLEDILDIVFFHGMLMQAVVERDDQGRSQYGMAAVDPSRLGCGIDESVLTLAINAICERSKELLEVVNYNVRDSTLSLEHCVSCRVVFDGVRANSHEYRMLLKPLLWVCHNFRVVAYLRYCNNFELHLSSLPLRYLDELELEARSTYNYSKLSYLRYSTHLLAREITVFLDERTVYSGEALEMISRAPYDGCSFPLARKITFLFVKDMTDRMGNDFGFDP